MKQRILRMLNLYTSEHIRNAVMFAVNDLDRKHELHPGSLNETCWDAYNSVVYKKKAWLINEESGKLELPQ